MVGAPDQVAQPMQAVKQLTQQVEELQRTLGTRVSANE